MLTQITLSILKHIIRKFWDTAEPIEEWETGFLKILPKKEDMSLPGNHRGIMLLYQVSYKIIANILRMRLKPKEEELDHESQSGEVWCASEINQTYHVTA